MCTATGPHLVVGMQEKREKMVPTNVMGFPQLAPLSTPLVKHLLGHQEVTISPAVLSAIKPTDRIDQATRVMLQRWQHFERRVQEKRLRTFTVMSSAVQVDHANFEQYVAPAWLRTTLSHVMPAARGKRKETITAQTLAVWSEKHILRHRGWGQLDAQSVAGILMARQMDETRERLWLPSVMDANEPYWWCYSQALPVQGKPSPLVPCPLPLPQNLPPSTLLWTPWAGASWDPRWLQIGYLGAIRWAGAELDKQGRVQWNMSEADLKRWDPEIFALDMGNLRNTREMLNGAAHFALLRLALSRLSVSTSGVPAMHTIE